MTNVYMIGVNHNDPDGDRKLDKTLKRIKPDIILIEGSQATEEENREFMAALVRGISASGLPRELQQALLQDRGSGYEWKRSRTYARQYHARLDFLNDDSEHAKAFQPVDIEDVHERVASELAYLLDPKYVAGIYQRNAISSYLSGLAEHLHRTLIKTPREHELACVSQLPKPDKRDVVMATTLREHISQNTRARIATVTGYLHITSRPTRDSFYDRVADLQPERIFQFLS